MTAKGTAVPPRRAAARASTTRPGCFSSRASARQSWRPQLASSHREAACCPYQSASFPSSKRPPAPQTLRPPGRRPCLLGAGGGVAAIVTSRTVWPSIYPKNPPALTRPPARLEALAPTVRYGRRNRRQSISVGTARNQAENDSQTVPTLDYSAGKEGRSPPQLRPSSPELEDPFVSRTPHTRRQVMSPVRSDRRDSAGTRTSLGDTPVASGRSCTGARGYFAGLIDRSVPRSGRRPDRSCTDSKANTSTCTRYRSPYPADRRILHRCTST